MKIRHIIIITLIAGLILPHLAGAFVEEYKFSAADPPGFFRGIWHGLIAPYSLIARWFNHDIVMYALPNTGWFYDIGFLLGVGGSLPIGWLAAIISIFV